MGSVELALLIKYGIPLAVKLLSNGKNEPETVEAVNTVITGISSGGDVSGALLNADETQTNNIVDGFFGLLTGVSGALGNLVKGLGSLFSKKPV